MGYTGRKKIMLRKFLEGVRPEFVDSVASILRTNKSLKKQTDGISIPSPKFYNKKTIAFLFIQHGRIPTKIDTTTFQNRVMVECEDGEVWTGRINLAERESVFVLQLPSREEQAREANLV
jgi:hypothetical protein